jgi:hypothetical protein
VKEQEEGKDVDNSEEDNENSEEDEDVEEEDDYSPLDFVNFTGKY